MEKSDFINLNELEQLDFINTKLKENKLGEIAKEIGVSQSWLSKHFVDLGYRYRKGKYIKKVLAPDREKEKTSTDKKTIHINTEYIDLDEKPKGRTFLLPRKVLEEWDQFCKEHIIYKNQHLIMMALLEYMKRH